MNKNIKIPMIPPPTITKSVSSLSEIIDWGLEFTQVCKYQKEKNTMGSGVNIAVLDTGIAALHPDLKDNVKFEIDFTGDNRPYCGHGTHVAGIIAAAADGVGVIGVAPEASLYSIRVLDSNGLCPADYRYVIQGLEWVKNHPEINIVNISLGAAIIPPNRMHSLIKELSDRGVIIVAASGNEGAKKISYPAQYKECIAVAAMDSNGKITNFSNVDQELDILAPGVDIYSTWVNGGYGYAKESGTCLIGETLIVTPSGPISIENIKVGDNVFSCNQNLTIQKNTISKKWNRGIKPVFKISTNNWSLFGTENHPILTINQNKCLFEWKKINELKQGDIVFHISNLPTEKYSQPIQFINDVDTAKMIGFILGSGWDLAQKSPKHMVGFNRNKSESVNLEYENLLLKITKNKIYKTKDNQQVYTFDENLYEIFNDIVNENKIMKYFFNAPKKIRKHFLIGYLDTDKTELKNKFLTQLTISSLSKNTILDIKHLLYTIGVNTKDVDININGEYSIKITTLEICKLFDIDILNSAKQKQSPVNNESIYKLITKSNFKPGIIKNIEYIEETNVFDIEMKDQTAPCFIADGFIVHNSMSAPFISGLLALMISRYKQNCDCDTPITNYIQAIERLKNFQNGILVGELNKNIGIGVTNISSHPQQFNKKKNVKNILLQYIRKILNKIFNH